MFVGYSAVVIAAKAAQPRAPFWTYVAGRQALDRGGIEKEGADRS